MPFECAEHNFTTTSPVEFYEHERELAHNYDISGSTCKDCGTKIENRSIKALLPAKSLVIEPMCKECQDKADKVLIERLKEEGKIKK